MRLKDKVATITGAAQGIGRACAEGFAREGAKVVVSDINGDGAAAVAEAIRSAGGEATSCVCDVGDKQQVDAMIATAVETFGRLDIHLSNAAVIHAAEFLDITEEDWQRVLRINLTGFFLSGQSAARQMVAQGGGGAIINMSSINAVVAIPNYASYVVCKGGVNQLTKTMSLALAENGIRVNGIGPGTIMTEMGRSVVNDEAALRKMLSRTPLGRGGEPEEVAALAIVLASEDASYITGETIYIDGGRLGLNYTVPVAD